MPTGRSGACRASIRWSHRTTPRPGPRSPRASAWAASRRRPPRRPLRPRSLAGVRGPPRNSAAEAMNIEAWTAANRPRLLEELLDFIRAPSVSTDPSYAEGVARAAGILAARLERIGLEHVQLLDGGGHKAVYGAWLHAPGAPTLLVYGHYDVQPPDPVELWHTPPFEPTIVDGRIVARG